MTNASAQSLAASFGVLVTTTLAFTPGNTLHPVASQRQSLRTPDGLFRQLNASLNDNVMLSTVFPAVALAIVLGVAGQGLINSMVQGEQGLGAYLRDGKGFAGSGFRPVKERQDKQDPLPWLILPELDFVDVAGQNKSSSNMKAEAEMEQVRQRMNLAVEKGNLEQANELRLELEKLMEANGYDFTPEDNLRK